MNYLIDKGMAFYWGTSHWSASQIMEAYKICDKLNLIPPVVEQAHYNMMVRERMENEYRDLFQRYKMGTTIFSPLESGIFAGRYLNGIPEDFRANIKRDNAANNLANYLNNKKEWDEKLLKLKDIAEKNLIVLWLNYVLHGLFQILIVVRPF